MPSPKIPDHLRKRDDHAEAVRPWLPLEVIARRLAQVIIEPDVEGDPELAWQDDAICSQTDPEMFFPEKGGSTREAKAICKGCEVKAACLQYALDHDERFGIWGGYSERERRRLKRGIA